MLRVKSVSQKSESEKLGMIATFIVLKALTLMCIIMAWLSHMNKNLWLTKEEDWGVSAVKGFVSITSAIYALVVVMLIKKFWMGHNVVPKLGENKETI